ncbi:MAG: radical SAM protein [bacterium]|nr:radical SAM protein [bacterium]
MNKIYGHTIAFCPECKTGIQSRIIEENGQVFLEKMCPEHGLSRVMIAKDPKWYQQSQYYIKPKQEQLKTGTTAYKSCPDSCGHCPEHQQHICLPVIEVTSQCDLSCPVCLKSFKTRFELALPQLSKMIDKLTAYEGKVDVINLSGGEPVLHSKFAAILTLIKKKGITQTTISTNGLQLLKNRSLRDLIRKDNAIVALQFDGFTPKTYKQLRGLDISGQKLDLIRLMEKEGVKYSLVATVADNINKNEIPDIVDFFFRHQALSLMFQPITLTGNAVSFSPLKHRLTMDEVVSKIAESPFVKHTDFNPLPCSHYSCFSLSYYLKGEAGRFVGLKEFLGEQIYLDLISNKTLPALDMAGRKALIKRLYDIWSAADSYGLSKKAKARIARTVNILGNQSTRKETLSLGLENMKAIFIHEFMDAHTFDYGRMIKCCNPYLQEEGRAIPMCAQNVLVYPL